MQKNKRNKSASATDQTEEHSRKRRRQSSVEAGGDESASNSEAKRLLDVILTRKEKTRLIHKDFRKLPNQESYPDYYDEIDNPISLDEIEERVNRNEYPSLDAVKKDLELMCQNALIYYKVSTTIYKDAQILQQIVRDYVSSSRRNVAAPVATSNRSSTLPDGPPNTEVQDRMVEVIDALINLEDSSGIPVYDDFRNLVKRKDYPDYYKIIKTPMSLNTVRTRASKGKYSTWDDMKRELDIIIVNAQTYNEEGSEIYDLANDLRDHINQYIECGRVGKPLPNVKPATKPVKEEEPDQRPVIQQRPTAPQRTSAQSKTPNLSNGHTSSQNGSYAAQRTVTPAIPPATMLSTGIPNPTTDFGASPQISNYNPPVLTNDMSIMSNRLFTPQLAHLPPQSYNSSRMRPGQDVDMNDASLAANRASRIGSPERMDVDTKPNSPKIEELPRYFCLTSLTISHHHSSGVSQEIAAIDLQQPIRAFFRHVAHGVSMVRIEFNFKVEDGDALYLSGKLNNRLIHAISVNERVAYDMPLQRGEQTTLTVCATVRRPSSTGIGFAQFRQFVYIDIFRAYD